MTIKVVVGAAAIAAVVASPATAQNCVYNYWYGRVICMPPQRYEQQYPTYYPGGSPYVREPGPVIDNSGGCEGGSCVNLGPGYR
jgi:hypothetical protein